MKRLLYMLILVIFTGCGVSVTDNSDDSYLQYLRNLDDYVMPNITSTNKIYDYYEIAQDEILYSAINIDYVNVMGFFNESELGYNSSHYEIDENHNIYNEALGIDEIKDCMIFYEYDALSKIAVKTTYVKQYGLYEVTKNICTVNYDVKGCESYLYVRYY